MGYVDDRAIQFDGDWAGGYEKITGFTAWEEGPIKPTEPPLDYCGQLLIEDFSQSMEMHRHYDSLNWQITKFAFGEILVAIGVCWTVFNLDSANEATPNLKWIVMLLICAESWLFVMLSIYTIVKNKVYFVRTARHINELRNHVLQRKPFGFANETYFWSNPAYPIVRDYRSTQYVSFYMIVILTTALSCAALFSVTKMSLNDCCYWLIAPAVFTIALSVLIISIVARESFKP